MKFYDSELKVMDLLWRNGALSAKQIADELKHSIGWNKNTSYTVIKKLVDKGAVRRTEPGFFCTPLIEQEAARQSALTEVLDKFYQGSVGLLFASLLTRESLSPEEVEQLRSMIEERK
ncbi:MAG: BlaI/MecI/CopY family transcriptional regulator [Schaedlerella sp.]|uniref:BlaI/MecI/CopY family transcriptional regulator n=1 Tax=Schaedlerella sp. TaxID=2676057 RepID=UPI00262096F9|nr:BlaI/MecI/CopY family transcriptional regulator [uncultured Schaedlerella sp.]